MRTLYDPAADGSCDRMLDVLTSALDAEEDREGQGVCMLRRSAVVARSPSLLVLHGLLFIGRVCHELATTSTFVSDLNLSENSESRALYLSTRS